MISAPDFKEKQILFVNAEWGKPSHLRFLNDNIVFEKERRVANRVSVHKAFAVFICGDLSLTTSFLKQAKNFGISIFFLKNNFEMYGGMFSVAEGHYLLRFKQYQATSSEEFAMAKGLVLNKIWNQVAVLKEKADSNRKRELDDIFEQHRLQIDNANDENVLRGIEGNFSRSYFSEYFKEVKWRRRAPRTKEDINNFLLDMGYTFLFNFVDSLLRLHGFDTYKGFYHKLFFQRRSLACDVMEPLRCLIDRQILKAFHLKQIDESDFNVVNGAYQLPFDKNAKYAGIFLQCLMERKEGIFEYIHAYYRHVMDPVKNHYPSYVFRNRL